MHNIAGYLEYIGFTRSYNFENMVTYNREDFNIVINYKNLDNSLLLYYKNDMIASVSFGYNIEYLIRKFVNIFEKSKENLSNGVSVGNILTSKQIELIREYELNQNNIAITGELKLYYFEKEKNIIILSTDGNLVYTIAINDKVKEILNMNTKKSTITLEDNSFVEDPLKTILDNVIDRIKYVNYMAKRLEKMGFVYRTNPGQGNSYYEYRDIVMIQVYPTELILSIKGTDIIDVSFEICENTSENVVKYLKDYLSV